MKQKKLVIIGIDSATFDLINPMIREGKLQNLSSLIRNGTSGILQSTVPPVTPPAWVSFMTGKNPGKHGVFDFYVTPSHGYERPVWNSKFIKATTMWKIMSDKGLQAGLVNMPMTYPPEKINGFVIPGVQYSFDGIGEFSHPPELMREITELVGDYKVMYGDLESLYTSFLDRFLEEWRKIFEIRRKTILYLMENKEWNIFTAVFSSIDLIQHHFWKFSDTTHPQYDPQLSPKYGQVISEFYERIDAVIGEILEHIDDKTAVVVVSDHGAGPEQEGFSLNTWLQREGFLHFRQSVSLLWRFRFPHLLYKLLKRMGSRSTSWTVPLDQLKALHKAVDPREGLNVPFFIDWKRTLAFAGNHTEQGIYINLKGREHMGVVERGKEYEEIREAIINKLKTIRDPKDGNPLEMEIFKKEEVYHGPFTDEAPDIFVVMKGGRCLMQKEIYHRELFYRSNKTSGTHRMEGIFIIKGRGIKPALIMEGASIIDLAPTILYMLGIPVPEDMDGKVMLEAFDMEYVSDNPVSFGPPSELDVKGDEGIMSMEESEKVKNSLRDLGYFG